MTWLLLLVLWLVLPLPVLVLAGRAMVLGLHPSGLSAASGHRQSTSAA